MASWINALSKTRKNILGGLGKLFGSEGRLDEDSLELLEENLIKADVAPKLVMSWIEQLENKRGGESHRDALRNMLLDALGEEDPFKWDPAGSAPYAILIVGINGSGKTTTCAKLAYHARTLGHKVLLAATDTFRAAGADQLRIWSDRVKCDVVAGKQGSDAAAVAYDSVDAAMARKADFLIVDTAGRMHTKGPLMQELKKVKRAMQKKREDIPQETWIVLDASLGQNAVNQAREFNEITPLTGVVITKLDGSSKGGFLFSVRQELNVPIVMVGLGEQETDLVAFSAVEFVDALLEQESS